MESVERRRWLIKFTHIRNANSHEIDSFGQRLSWRSVGDQLALSWQLGDSSQLGAGQPGYQGLKLEPGILLADAFDRAVDICRVDQ